MGNRKAIWVHADHFEHYKLLAEYDGITVPMTMKRLTLILKRAGIQDLNTLEQKLKHSETR